MDRSAARVHLTGLGDWQAPLGELLAAAGHRPVDDAADADVILFGGELPHADAPRVALLDAPQPDQIVALLSAGAHDVWPTDLPAPLLTHRVAGFARTFSVDGLVHDIAHDMKGPLSSIHRYATMVLEDAEGLVPDDRRFLERIAVNAARLSHLVNQLVGLVRADSRPLNPEPVRLSSALRVAARAVGDVEVEAPDVVTVHADPDRLTELLTQALDNVVRYQTDTPAVAEVRARIEDGVVQLQIGSRGHPVPDDARETVFKPFARLHRQDEIEGAGLGLTIVRRIAERHGGRAWLEVDGEHARLCVTLPLR